MRIYSFFALFFFFTTLLPAQTDFPTLLSNLLCIFAFLINLEKVMR